ncbi:DUF5125 domain-containing protein [Proteiniphilum sp.]|uniref:DUF5121 domain-containing protein n=1 Tax=Proteiniphilum sp. TaxID=1926877 RepID=UPI00332E9B6E
MNLKKLKYWMFASVISFGVLSCSDDVKEPQQGGNPTMQIEDQFANVHFGDLLPFEVSVSDNLPLSTLTAILYFGEEEVSKTIIRTKENGKYSGTVAVPYGKNIPDGAATLKFTLINTTMKKVSQEVTVPVTRAPYPYLILVTADASYPMLPTGQPNEYAATESFPSTELPAYIKTPVVDSKGREIIFGWDEGEGGITEGATTDISFVSREGGVYSVTFNARTFEASPFFELVLNEKKMEMINKENYQLDINLETGDEIVLEGLTDWWVDPDFFAREDDKVTFIATDGKYRIIANPNLNYLKVEAMTGNDLATLQPDGTGAIWIIGDNIGKPSVAENAVGWNTDKAICMVAIGDKKYQMTVVGGETISTEDINFKFFHQKGWGGEFSNETLTTKSDLVFVGAKEDPGPGNSVRDPGNLGLYKGKKLKEGNTYLFTVDVSAGIDKAVLTVEER